LSVLGIVGSPRKNGLTAKVVQKAIEGVAKAGIKTEIIYLADSHIQPCRDCHPTLACWEKGLCYHKDDFETISKRIDDARGIILGSAVYYGDVTRSVDNIINKKVRHRKDRPKEGIPGIGIAVAGGMGGGYASALRRIYHFYRIIGVRGQKPIPVTRFNQALALDAAFQAGLSMASLIEKEDYPIGPQRLALFLDLPILGFDYMQERFYLIKQIIDGAQREKGIEAVEKAAAIYKKAEELRTKDKAGALTLVEEAYKLGTAVWNPERR
jgi:NAD(P)H-dependent FMN reductase